MQLLPLKAALPMRLVQPGWHHAKTIALAELVLLPLKLLFGIVLFQLPLAVAVLLHQIALAELGLCPQQCQGFAIRPGWGAGTAAMAIGLRHRLLHPAWYAV